MTVNEIKPNLLILECKQEPNDKDYGSCLWARFAFNLNRYELSITSDCGTYGHKWVETPSESFLHLMGRCDSSYILGKIYGRPDIFDFEETKKNIYKTFSVDDDDKELLDKIFEQFEYEPESQDDFVKTFEEYYKQYSDIDADDYYVWQCVEHTYPMNVLKICEIFENYIKTELNSKYIERK